MTRYARVLRHAPYLRRRLRDKKLPDALAAVAAVLIFVLKRGIALSAKSTALVTLFVIVPVAAARAGERAGIVVAIARGALIVTTLAASFA